MIGSFGYGTPAKGFELLVEAVNREFECAEVRINVPYGTHVDTDVIHRKPYAQHLQDVCKKIAKPGIHVSFTEDFLSPEDLVSWCAGNDLNCFMYTRALPGLSATTDQCIISGQPLLTLTNDTFRHIHRYIEPYPFKGLRQTLANGGRRVQDIQNDWSKERFLDLFHRMLDKHGVISAPDIAPMRHERPNGAPIVVVSPHGRSEENLFDYAQKLVNALGRSRQQEIVHLSYREASDLLLTRTTPPSGVILVDYDLTGRMMVETAVQSLNCPKVIIPDSDELSAIEYPHHWSNTVVFPRLPIIPFQTNSEGLRSPPAIILLGFARCAEVRQDLLGRIMQEPGAVQIFVESSQPEDLLRDLAQVGMPVHAEKKITTARFDPGDPSVVSRFGESTMIIAYNDTAHTRDLETLVCLAMTTERPVIFTRASPFAGLADSGTFVEDHAISELIEMGLSAHVKPLYDFGEWSIATSLRRILDGSWHIAFKVSPKDAIPVLSPRQALQIAVLGTATPAKGGRNAIRVQSRGRRGDPISRAVGWVKAGHYFRQGDRFRDKRQWQDAANQYRQGLALAPERFALWVQYGHMAKESGDFGAAEQAYGEALLLGPNDADLHVQLGHLYSLRGDLARMRACYNRARELGSKDSHANPSNSPAAAAKSEFTDDAQTCFARGDHLRDIGEWQTAADAYAAGLRIAPEAGEYWIQLGNMRKEAGCLAESERAYQRALRIMPTDQDLHLQLGHLLLTAGRSEEARDRYQTAVAMGSRDTYAIAAILSTVEQHRLLRDAIRRTAGNIAVANPNAAPTSFNREILHAYALKKSN